MPSADGEQFFAHASFQIHSPFVVHAFNSVESKQQHGGIQITSSFYPVAFTFRIQDRGSGCMPKPGLVINKLRY
jgi:hypothetical protein